MLARAKSLDEFGKLTTIRFCSLFVSLWHLFNQEDLPSTISLNAGVRRGCQWLQALGLVCFDLLCYENIPHLWVRAAVLRIDDVLHRVKVWVGSQLVVWVAVRGEGHRDAARTGIFAADRSGITDVVIFSHHVALGRRRLLQGFTVGLNIWVKHLNVLVLGVYHSLRAARDVVLVRVMLLIYITLGVSLLVLVWTNSSLTGHPGTYHLGLLAWSSQKCHEGLLTLLALVLLKFEQGLHCLHLLRHFFDGHLRWLLLLDDRLWLDRLLNDACGWCLVPILVV